MNIERFKEILKEEVEAAINEASITRRFSKAVEAYRTIQLKQQDLRKKFVGEKDPKKKEALKKALIDLHKKVQKAESDFNAALRIEPVDLDEDKNEGFASDAQRRAAFARGYKAKGKKGKKKKNESINEVKPTAGPIDTLANDIGGKVYMATGGGTAEAQSTNKTWDDGVPVLKYIARAKKQRVKLPKKFRVVVDEKYGWFYYFDKGKWYGIDKDKYGTPPFEY
tara:strand:+ start:56 stop:727 length:672 start_codon:yes stop_codon:yes gene_type:complete